MPLNTPDFSLNPNYLVCLLCLVLLNEQILEKSDYTMISGSPFIKKSGM